MTPTPQRLQRSERPASVPREDGREAAIVVHEIMEWINDEQDSWEKSLLVASISVEHYRTCIKAIDRLVVARIVLGRMPLKVISDALVSAARDAGPEVRK